MQDGKVSATPGGQGLTWDFSPCKEVHEPVLHTTLGDKHLFHRSAFTCNMCSAQGALNQLPDRTEGRKQWG